MAATKQPPGVPGQPASTLAPKRPSPRTGQTYGERKAADRVELSMWVSTETGEKLKSLVKVLGKKFPKEVVEQAINELAAKYNL